MSGKRVWLIVLAVALLYTASADISRASSPPPPSELTRAGPTPALPGWTPKVNPWIRVTEEGEGGGPPDVAYGSKLDRYLVVWERSNSIWGCFVSGRGEKLGEAFEISRYYTTHLGPPRVAYDPSRNRFLVIWTRHHASGAQLGGFFVPESGFDPSQVGFIIDLSWPVYSEMYSLAYGSRPDDFLVVWVSVPSGSTNTVILGRRVKGAGGFAANTFLISSASVKRGSPDVAYNAYSNQYLVVYDDWPKSNENIYGVRLSASGGPVGGGEAVIAGWPGDEISPAVAACPSEDGYAVVWNGYPEPEEGFWLRFVSGSGALGAVNELLRRDWFTVGHKPLDIACGRTGLSMEGPSYLAAWAGSFPYYGYGYARVVSTSGAMSEVFDFGSGSGPLAVAGGEVNHLVVWAEGYESEGDYYHNVNARIIGNTKPKAALTVTPQQGDSNTLFHFDASGSSDTTDPAAALQVRWDWESDGSYDTSWSTTKIIDHQFTLPPGTSWAATRVTVEVTDGHGTTDTADVIFNLLNTRPVATFDVTPSSGDGSTLFTFDASASTDAEDGQPGLFRWDWTSDSVWDTAWRTTPTIQHRFGSDGAYTVRLEVQDSAGQTAWASRPFVVGAGGLAYRAYVPLALRASP